MAFDKEAYWRHLIDKSPFLRKKEKKKSIISGHTAKA